MRYFRPVIIACVFAFLNAPASAQNGSQLTGGNGTLYIGGFAQKIYVIDEATEQVVDEIRVSTGTPRVMTLSADRERFYLYDTTMEHIEIIDIASRSTLDAFTLSDGSTKVRIRNFEIDPKERYLIIQTWATTKLVDRFEIDPMRLVQYDLGAHEIVRDIPWPTSRRPGRAPLNMVFSPDGSLLYFFLDEIIIYETTNFTEVDRWDLSQPLEPGLGRIQFGFRDLINEEPGLYTGLFTVQSPVRDGRQMGVARVNLTEKKIDYFYTLGPAIGVSFNLTPDRTMAYGLAKEYGQTEFWSFDLENRRLGPRQRFHGRPRLLLKPSSNGQLLYLYYAGETIDVYEAGTYRYLRTLELEADQRTNLFVIPPN
ncbi:MAG: hypothetical protein VX471_07160 [Acidobacteriota bacterium]|nr:hypothetical protein [Acidobacteriota bacterium]